MQLQLHQQNSGNALFGKILAEVYIGLTDDEALRLSSRHNARYTSYKRGNGHFIHKMTMKIM